MSDVDAGATRPSRDRTVIYLLAAYACSTAAYTAIATVLGIQVYELSRHELDLGLLGMAQFAPGLFLVLLTGYVSDRYDRALICAVSAVGQGVISVALAVYAGTHSSSVTPIFLLVVMLGVARAFLSAAQGPLPADIVAPARLPWLVARRSLASRSGQIVGPVIGGALYLADRSLPYLLAALLFAGAAVLLWMVHGHRRRAARAPDRTTAVRLLSPRREAFEGLRVIRTSPLLLGAISLDLFAVLFGGAIALLPAIAEDRLGVDAFGLGLLRAAGGVGSVVVLVMLVRSPIERRVGRTLLSAIAVFGVATVTLGATTEFLVALAAMAVLSGADSISVFIRSNLVPLSSPAAKRGRVAAVESLFVGASNELGAFESGVTGELLGSSGAVILGGIATLAIVAAYSVALPPLRRLDRYPLVDQDAGPAHPVLTGADTARDASLME